MAFNQGNAENMAGLDTIANNTRIRASTSPVTIVDSSGTVTLPASPLGINYIDGIGTPFSTSVAGTGTSITLSASNLLTGIIVLQSATSSYTSITDTAAHIWTACNAVCPSGVQTGDFLACLIMNDSVSSCSLSMGAGVTSANAVSSSIAGQSSRYCLFRMNNPTSVNMYF